VAKIVATPLLPMARLAAGVTVVPTGALMLFVKSGSAVVEDAEAILVMVPFPGAVTVNVRLVVP